MFSFIKAIQSLLANLKKKKGLWFSILTTISITGIFLSMYLLTSMAKTVAKDVYVNMSNSYKKSLEVKLLDKQRDYRNMVLALKSNDNFVANLNNQPLLDGIIKKYNDNLASNGYEGISIKYYSTVNQVGQFRNSINSAINRKSSLFGTEVLLEGPSLVYLETVFSGDNVIGLIEIKQSLLALKKDFENSQGIFLFLIQERVMNGLSTEIKDGDYRVVIDDLKVEEKKYDGQFFANIIEDGSEGFKALKEEGYRANDAYFRTYKEVFDVNGTMIGYMVVGEKVQGTGAFVSIVDNLTKTVTMIALGLVISILLFMF